MTINYTTLLGLAQPVTGTEAGTWGTVVNDEITALVEQAIAGGTSINVTAGNVTLTTTTGASNQARNAVLIVTGTPGTTRNIIAPSTSKVYIVLNGSDGAVVIKGAATTGVTIAAGNRSIVAWNGSDFVEVGQAGDVDGPASSTDTAIAKFSGTSGKLIQNSGVTIDGSNNVAGVAALTASGNLTLNGGTANGVLYLNASKVATSGSAITFDGTNFATTGTASATKFIPTGGTATGNGMYLPAANTLAWSTNGAERMRLDPFGNLGLGVTPSAWNTSGTYFKAIELGSVGSALAGLASGFQTSLSTNAYYSGGWVYAGTGAATQYYQTAGLHIWQTAPSGTAGNAITFTQAMTLDASGNLGIGVTSPSSKLDVAGPATAGLTTIVKLRTGSGNSSGLEIKGNYSTEDWLFNNFYSGYIAFGTNNAERMRIDPNGNVGINTTAPEAITNYNTLEVKGGTTSAGGIFQSTTSDNSIKARFFTNSNGGLINVVTNHGLLLFTNSTERARITSGGDLLIGNTSFTWTPNTKGYQFQNPASGTWFVVTGDASGAGSTFGPTVYNLNATYNGTRFSVRVDGGIENYSANNVNLSDERVKTNIELSGNYLDKICAIPIKLFNYKDEPEGTQKSLGVIAQDVELIIPEFVNASDGWGHKKIENETPLKTVYETDLMFALMKSIQELNTKVETLEAQNAAFEARLASLESK